MSALSLENVSYHYSGSREDTLQCVNAEFEQGKFYAIVGKSGAGKSTLLSLLAGLDKPTEGRVLYEGEDIAKTGYSEHRKHHVSLIFQSYNLIDYLTPLENVRLVNKHASERLLIDLGLDESQIRRNVLQLSGGQQQRVAIARALAAESAIILADEPTGNLDEHTADGIIEILRQCAHDHGQCVIVVTHSMQVVRAADVVLEMKSHHMNKRSTAKSKR